MDMRTCTLDELIAALEEAREDFGGDKKVVFASNYGDRFRTQQAHGLRGDVEETALVKSGYSDSGYAVPDNDDDMDEDERDDDNVVLLIK